MVRELPHPVYAARSPAGPPVQGQNFGKYVNASACSGTLVINVTSAVTRNADSGFAGSSPAGTFTVAAGRTGTTTGGLPIHLRRRPQPEPWPCYDRLRPPLSRSPVDCPCRGRALGRMARPAMDRDRRIDISHLQRSTDLVIRPPRPEEYATVGDPVVEAYRTWRSELQLRSGATSCEGRYPEGRTCLLTRSRPWWRCGAIP